MSLGNDTTGPPARDDAPQVPPTDRRKMVAAGVLLLVPVVALMWVPSYAQETPELAGFPFFFWYQFLWVFLCSAMTWSAYLLVRSGRPRKDRPRKNKRTAADR